MRMRSESRGRTRIGCKPRHGVGCGCEELAGVVCACGVVVVRGTRSGCCWCVCCVGSPLREI